MSRAVMVTNCTRRVEKNVSGATKRASGRLALKGGEGRIDLAARADVEDIDLQPDDVGRILHVPQVGRRGGDRRAGPWQGRHALSCQVVQVEKNTQRM